MADTLTSSSAEHPVKDDHATVNIADPTPTTDAPVDLGEEPLSDPVNSTTADGNATRVTLTITRVSDLSLSLRYRRSSHCYQRYER